MSAISGISGVSYPVAPQQAQSSNRPAPAPAPAAVASDPDHDGDSHKASRIDVKA